MSDIRHWAELPKHPPRKDAMVFLKMERPIDQEWHTCVFKPGWHLRLRMRVSTFYFIFTISRLQSSTLKYCLQKGAATSGKPVKGQGAWSQALRNIRGGKGGFLGLNRLETYSWNPSMGASCWGKRNCWLAWSTCGARLVSSSSVPK